MCVCGPFVMSARCAVSMVAHIVSKNLFVCGGHPPSYVFLHTQGQLACTTALKLRRRKNRGC